MELFGCFKCSGSWQSVGKVKQLPSAGAFIIFQEIEWIRWVPCKVTMYNLYSQMTKLHRPNCDGENGKSLGFMLLLFLRKRDSSSVYFSFLPWHLHMVCWPNEAKISCRAMINDLAMALFLSVGIGSSKLSS